MSLPLAQLLTTAIALAYGLVFLGLWLSLRRQAVLAFAGVWMAQGALAVATATLAPLAIRSGVVRVFLPTLVLATTLLFVDLALVTAARSRARRRFWQWALPLLALGAAALALLNDPNRLPGIVRLFRLLTSATLAAALVLVWRAPPSAGKRSTFVAVALVFARFAGGLVLTLAVPDAFTVSSQPVAFTVYQLLVTLLAGFFTTVAIFAVERESTLRERVVLERAVASAQRMESLGRMAGSVAHDFNNVLGALLASSEPRRRPRRPCSAARSSPAVSWRSASRP